MIPECYDCGLAYGGEGWCDVGVSNEVWARISPSGHYGGLLCFTCMARRLARGGLEGVPVAIRSGPWECSDRDLNNGSPEQEHAQQEERATLQVLRDLMEASDDVDPQGGSREETDAWDAIIEQARVRLRVRTRALGA